MVNSVKNEDLQFLNGTFDDMEFKDLSGGTFFWMGMILLRNSRHDQGVCLFG